METKSKGRDNWRLHWSNVGRDLEKSWRRNGEHEQGKREVETALVEIVQEKCEKAEDENKDRK